MSRLTPLAMLTALVLGTLVAAPEARAQDSRTISITGSGIYRPALEKASAAFKRIKAQMMQAEGEAFDRLSREASAANRKLKELKARAKRFGRGTITFHGVGLSETLAGRIRDWFVQQKKRGGAYHVFLKDGRVRISTTPPAKAAPAPAPAPAPTPMPALVPGDGKVHDKSELPSEPDIFGQG